MDAYPGPLRSEPIAVELHNTIYAEAREIRDGLADRACAEAFVGAIAGRLPTLPALPSAAAGDLAAGSLAALRGPVRAALQAVVRDEEPSDAVLAALNRASAAAPVAIQAARADAARDGPRLTRAYDYHGASAEAIVLAAFAADAIELITGPRASDLHTCGAPGCVLLFLRDRPRQEWCCPACGNRARVARHYRRARGDGP